MNKSNMNTRKYNEMLSRAFQEEYQSIAVIGNQGVGRTSLTEVAEQEEITATIDSKDEVKMTINELNNLDIPLYKLPTGKERRRANRKGKKARFKVGSKPEQKPVSKNERCKPIWNIDHYLKI